MMDETGMRFIWPILRNSSLPSSTASLTILRGIASANAVEAIDKQSDTTGLFERGIWGPFWNSGRASRTIYEKNRRRVSERAAAHAA
jgi:hypothetical protein